MNFTHLVITAPTQDTANVYSLACNAISTNLPCARNLKIHVVADPELRRVGSGGGTLNAIDVLASRIGVDSLKSSKVAILHSGGDARRAPLYSVCGKVWSSINSLKDNQLSCPLTLLLTELSEFCHTLPAGSITIASGDVLLDLPNAGDVLFPESGVSVVTVPTPPQTAKNHGVFVMSCDETYAGRSITAQPQHYLQKPSLKTMVDSCAALAGMDGLVPIDTGIVVLTGEAVNAIIELTASVHIGPCLTRFCQANPSCGDELRLELYSDILHALATRTGPCSEEEFHRRLGLPEQTAHPEGIYSRALHQVWSTLRDIPLFALFVPRGRFGHLGTTAEMKDMLTANTDDLSSSMRWFVDKFALINQAGSLVNSTSRAVDPRSVLMNSLVFLEESDPLLEHDLHAVGDKAVVEHCLLSGNVKIESDCFVSQVRHSLGHDLHLRRETLVQQIYLKTGPHCGDERSLTVVVVLGLRDDVKLHYLDPKATICGVPWSRLWEDFSISADDIWPGIDQAERTIWTAKLFPSMNQVVGLDVLWLQHLGRYDKFPIDCLQPVIERWKLIQPWDRQAGSMADPRSNQRFSLSDLLVVADARAQHLWSMYLQMATGKLGYDEEEQYLHTSELRQVLSDHESGPYVASELERTFEETKLAIERVSRLRREQLTPGRNYNDAAAQLLSLWCIQLCLRDGISVSTLSNHPLMPYSQTDLFPKEQGDIAELTVLFSNLWDSLNCRRAVDKLDGFKALLGLRFLRELAGRSNLHTVALSLLRCVTCSSESPESSLIDSHTQPRLLLLVGWLLERHLISGEAMKSFQSSCERSVEYTRYRALSEEGMRQTSLLQIQNCGASLISSLRIGLEGLDFESPDAGLTFSLRETIENRMQEIVCLQVRSSLRLSQKSIPADLLVRRLEPDFTRVVVSRAPVRVDIAGGWSDTPPICYESSGSVLNVAVRVDGRCPMACVSRFIPTPCIVLRSLRVSRQAAGCEPTYVGDPLSLDRDDDFEDACNPCAPCALLKAVLVVLGVVSPPSFGGRREEESLANRLLTKYGGGLEISCASDLPAGSGMGGSSILAAAVLESVTSTLGLSCSRELKSSLVSEVEQVMTCGGGWQDQVGAIYGGFKVGRSSHGLPLAVSVEELSVTDSFISALERRSVLLYTGQQRLAKNTLINALRKCALMPRSSESSGSVESLCRTIDSLVCGAEAGATLLKSHFQSPLGSDDTAVNQLAVILSRYWELKVALAAGSEPPHIAHLLHVLRPFCEGLSLCGAGAGGFAMLILKDDVSMSELTRVVEDLRLTSSDFSDVSLHSVSVDSHGLASEDLVVLPEADIAPYLF